MLVNETAENREVMDEAGFLYPFNDVEALTQLMRRLSTRPEDCGPYREQAQQRVRDLYNWETVVTQYEAMFHELIVH